LGLAKSQRAECQLPARRAKPIVSSIAAGGGRISISIRRFNRGGNDMIRKLKSGQFRLYSRKKDPKTGKRRNLGTFKTRAAAQKHERAVQFFKRK